MRIKEETIFVVLLVAVVTAWIGDAKSISRSKRDIGNKNNSTVDNDASLVGNINRIDRNKRNKVSGDRDAFEDKDENLMVLGGDTNRIVRHKRDTDDNDDGIVTVQRHLRFNRRHSVSVHHFGKHTLCLRHKMRRDFYRTLKDYYCMSDHLAAELVVSLCTSKGDVLDKFVSDIFDVDNDGYINAYEKYLPWYKR